MRDLARRLRWYSSIGRHALAYDIESLCCVPEPSIRTPDDAEKAAFNQADKEKTYERRRLEEDHAALLSMSPQLIGKTVTPFLGDHGHCESKAGSPPASGPVGLGLG